MQYFLMIGLMMVSSFAQADICIPLWWKAAVDVQLEIEAELKGPLAMNEPCEDSGKMPTTLALENTDYLPVFEAIVENFELDTRAQYQVRLAAGARLQRDYEALSANAGKVFERDDRPDNIQSQEGFIANLRDMSPEVQAMVLHLMGIPDEYKKVSVRGGAPTVTIRIDDEVNDERNSGYISENLNVLTKKEIFNLNYTVEPTYVSDVGAVDPRFSGPTLRERRAYDQALERYRTSLAIYNILVPSE